MPLPGVEHTETKMCKSSKLWMRTQAPKRIYHGFWKILLFLMTRILDFTPFFFLLPIRGRRHLYFENSLVNILQHEIILKLIDFAVDMELLTAKQAVSPGTMNCMWPDTAFSDTPDSNHDIPSSLHAELIAILASKLSTQLSTKSTGLPVRLPWLLNKLE